MWALPELVAALCCVLLLCSLPVCPVSLPHREDRVIACDRLSPVLSTPSCPLLSSCPSPNNTRPLSAGVPFSKIPLGQLVPFYILMLSVGSLFPGLQTCTGFSQPTTKPLQLPPFLERILYTGIPWRRCGFSFQTYSKAGQMNFTISKGIEKSRLHYTMVCYV